MVKSDMQERIEPKFPIFTHQLPCDIPIPDTSVEIIFFSLLFVEIGGKVQ